MTPLRSWPGHMRGLVAAFVLVAVFGYMAGLAYMAYNTALKPSRIVDHYEGNEEELEFGKSPAEMMGIVHTHLLGMGIVFLAVGLFFGLSKFPERFKTVIMVETMLSLLSTFGGLWLVAIGWSGFVWLVYPSSVLMISGFLLMSVVVFRECLCGTGKISR